MEPSIDWIDCQARKDVMNFFQFDPLAAHGIDVGAAKRNPTIVPVRFREIIRPENYNAFRRKFFRVHFQFVMANQVPHAYDFFMIVCGPVPLRERMAMPEAALAAVTGDAAARERAFKQLENTPSEPGASAEMAAFGTHRSPHRLTLSASCPLGRGPHRARAGWLWPTLWCKACSSMGYRGINAAAGLWRQTPQKA